MAEEKASTTPVEPPAGSGRTPLPTSSPGVWGALLGIGLGLGFMLLGAGSFMRDDPLPLPLVVGLVLIGGLGATTSWFAMRRVRLAWAFAIAIGATASLVCMFAGPKIRDAMDVSLGLALLPSYLGALAAVLLAMAGPEIK